DWRSSLAIAPVLTRPRPAAYILAPTEQAAADRLGRLGVAVTTLPRAFTIPTERYRVVKLDEAAKADVRGDDEGAGRI
ncbi:hypothetical protein, partial [Klebsiella pneumoniae]|uniref:hypothetical protein n=1 Tax=Klebsiella pneumoniae TaxID=573 RepID=UPI001954835D